MVIGFSVISVHDEYKNFLDHNYISAPSLMISIGLIIFCIAFFGCCGAIKENYCMLVTVSFTLREWAPQEELRNFLLRFFLRVFIGLI